MTLRQEIGEPALLEQLAEECTELAHAALKLARVERKENPTPKKKWECISSLIEEWADVIICLGEVSEISWAGDGTYFEEVYDTKVARMKERLAERKCHEVSGQRNGRTGQKTVSGGHKSKAGTYGRCAGAADRNRGNRGRRGRYRVLTDELGQRIRIKRALRKR